MLILGGRVWEKNIEIASIHLKKITIFRQKQSSRSTKHTEKNIRLQVVEKIKLKDI